MIVFPSHPNLCLHMAYLSFYYVKTKVLKILRFYVVKTKVLKILRFYVVKTKVLKILRFYVVKTKVLKILQEHKFPIYIMPSHTLTFCYCFHIYFKGSQWFELYA